MDQTAKRRESVSSGYFQATVMCAAVSAALHPDGPKPPKLSAKRPSSSLKLFSPVFCPVLKLWLETENGLFSRETSVGISAPALWFPWNVSDSPSPASVPPPNNYLFVAVLGSSPKLSKLKTKSILWLKMRRANNLEETPHMVLIYLGVRHLGQSHTITLLRLLQLKHLSMSLWAPHFPPHEQQDSLNSLTVWSQGYNHKQRGVSPCMNTLSLYFR